MVKMSCGRTLFEESSNINSLISDFKNYEFIYEITSVFGTFDFSLFFQQPF